MSKTSIDLRYLVTTKNLPTESETTIQKVLRLNELKQNNKEIREKILISRSDLNPFFKRSFRQNQNLTHYYKKMTEDIKILQMNVLQYTVMLQELNRNSRLKLEVNLIEKKKANCNFR